MKARRTKPNGHGDPVAELEASVTSRFEQGEEMAAKHARERIELDVKQRDRLLALATRHATELAELEARQLAEVGQLWRSQGRELGPGMRRQLGELTGWKGGANGKAR